MKNLIQSRRGIAIEMAIGAMFIMIALSIVLLSISGMQTQHKNQDLKEFEEKIILYEITDEIINNGKPAGEWEYKGYIIASNGNEYIVKNTNGETVLTIEFGNDGNTITSWGK